MVVYLDNHLVVCGSAQVLLSAAVASAYATFPLKSQAPVTGWRGHAGQWHWAWQDWLLVFVVLATPLLWCLASSAADVSSAALVAAVAGPRLGYMEGVLESCEALGWILGPPIVLHLPGPTPEDACKLLEEEPESAEIGEVQSDADLVSYSRLLVRLSAQGSPIFAYGACSGAMYSGLALHNRAIGTQKSALLQLLVAVSYLFAAPVVGRQCDECAGDWAALSKKLAIGWTIL
eukprot:s1601_g20.t5